VCGCGRCARQVTSGAEVEDAHEQEIFEFPWVVFDVSSKQVVDEMRVYVKPTLHPQIGVECAQAALGDDAAACMDAAGTLQQAVQVRPWPRCSARERVRALRRPPGASGSAVLICAAARAAGVQRLRVQVVYRQQQGLLHPHCLGASNQALALG